MRHHPRTPMQAAGQGRRRVQTQERAEEATEGRKNKQQFQFTTKSISKLKSPGNSNKNSSNSSGSARGGTGGTAPATAAGEGLRSMSLLCGFIARSRGTGDRCRSGCWQAQGCECIECLIKWLRLRAATAAASAPALGRCRRLQQQRVCVINAFGCCILRLKRLLLLCLPHEIRYALSLFLSLSTLSLSISCFVNNKKWGATRAAAKPLAFP